MKNLSKPASWLFTILCVMSLAYMTFNQVDKYFRNDDTSTISFKKFTKSKYPTYTICFEDNDDAGGLYKTIELGNIYKTKVYFDGKYVRLEKRNMTVPQFQSYWYPNDTTVDVRTLMGSSGLMHAPLDRNVAKFPKHWIIFNESYLIPPEVYKNSLKGVPSIIDNLSFQECVPKCGPKWAWDFEKNISYSVLDMTNINFSDVTWNLNEFLQDFSAKNVSGSVIGWNSDEYLQLQTTCPTPSIPNFCGKQFAWKLEFAARAKTDFPYYLSYQDTKRICYSPNIGKDFASVHDSITLDLEEMSSKLSYQDQFSSDLPFLRIYIHMPGQFIRMLGREVASYATSNLMSEHCEILTRLYSWDKSTSGPCFGTKVTFLLSQVTLLKKRFDARDRCNKTLEKEDDELLMSIIKTVGCIPAYWRDIIANRLQNHALCTKELEYQMIQKYVTDTDLARSLFIQPCEDMLVVTNIVKERGRLRKKNVLEKHKMTSYLDMEIIQGSEMYQEIENVKDFGVESCWSGIGGFVGIFLGYSLLQFPDLVATYFELSRQKIMSQLK